MYTLPKPSFTIIFAYFSSLLQVPSDDLPDGSFSLSGGAAVDCDAVALHPAAPFWPAQLQARCRRIRVAGEIRRRYVVRLRAAFHRVVLVLYLRFVLCPAGHVSDLLRRQEAAAALGGHGAVEGLRPCAQEPLQGPALLLAVEELRRRLGHWQDHGVLVKALFLEVRHGRSPL